MKQQMLHTPEGVRDIYSMEYSKKSILEEKLQKVFHLYGYHDIQTPTFEYLDVFGKEIGKRCIIKSGRAGGFFRFYRKTTYSTAPTRRIPSRTER